LAVVLYQLPFYTDKLCGEELRVKRDLTLQKKQYYRWLETSEPMRSPPTKKALAEILDVTVDTLVDWDKKLETAKAQYSSKEYFISRQEEIDKAAADAFVLRPNSQLFLSIKRVAGDIVESPVNVNVGVFTGDDYRRLDREAEEELRKEEKRLRVGIQGVEEVPKESTLLSD